MFLQSCLIFLTYGGSSGFFYRHYLIFSFFIECALKSCLMLALKSCWFRVCRFTKLTKLVYFSSMPCVHSLTMKALEKCILVAYLKCRRTLFLWHRVHAGHDSCRGKASMLSKYCVWINIPEVLDGCPVSYPSQTAVASLHTRFQIGNLHNPSQRVHLF